MLSLAVQYGLNILQAALQVFSQEFFPPFHQNTEAGAVFHTSFLIKKNGITLSE